MKRDPAAAAAGIRTVIHVDLQTLFPLYLAELHANGNLVHVSYRVGRWSEERQDYPRWYGELERPVRVIDRVAEVRIEGDGGYRFEAGGAVSVPPKRRTLERMTSMSSFGRR